MEGNSMLRKAFNEFLDPIILSESTKRFDAHYLFVDSLTHEEKKILLSYLVCIEDFEDYTKNPTREREAFKEYRRQMQILIDERTDELYRAIDEERKYNE